MSGSKVKDNENQIQEYKIIEDCSDEDLLSFDDLRELLRRMEILLENKIIQEPKSTKTESSKNYSTTNSTTAIVSDLTPERFDLIVKGFAGLTLHNDCSQTIDEEISIYNLVTGLNACENEFINRELIENALAYIRTNAILTDNARKNWLSKIGRFIDTRADSYFVLLKILKTHNQVYYDRFLVQHKLEIDLNDDFNYISIKEKAHRKEYHSEQQVLDDLLRVMAQVKKIFVWKEFHEGSDSYFYKFEPLNQVKQYLSQIKLWKDDNGELMNCWKVFDKSNDTRFD
jgi:hypothetical protein